MPSRFNKSPQFIERAYVLVFHRIYLRLGLEPLKQVVEGEKNDPRTIKVPSHNNDVSYLYFSSSNGTSLSFYLFVDFYYIPVDTIYGFSQWFFPVGSTSSPISFSNSSMYGLSLVVSFRKNLHHVNLE